MTDVFFRNGKKCRMVFIPIFRLVENGRVISRGDVTIGVEQSDRIGGPTSIAPYLRRTTRYAVINLRVIGYPIGRSLIVMLQQHIRRIFKRVFCLAAFKSESPDRLCI